MSNLRYGENPHQAAAVYRATPLRNGTLLAATQRSGKELSYNNYLDLDAALRIVRGFDRPAVSVIKHTNPCGFAAADQLSTAARRAMAGDPLSAFGSILGMNRVVDEPTADALTAPNQFIEAIIAPGYSEQAFQILTGRPKWKKNVRLMELMDLAGSPAELSIRQIDGGLLVQEDDGQPDDPDTWQVVTAAQPDAPAMQELTFAWHAVRHVRSNAIVIAAEGMLCGVGAGQMSRVDAVELAIGKAGDRTRGAVLASDAFFPFPDSIERAASAGIAAIIQPGGSRQDAAVIEACNTHGLSMLFTGKRHFAH